MKNKKGFAPTEVIVFLVAIIFVAGFLLVTRISIATASSLSTIDEKLSSAAVMAENLVNSKECLLYEGKAMSLAGNEFNLGTRSIIDWDKADNLEADCIQKGQFAWKAKYNFKGISDPSDVGSSCILSNTKTEVPVAVVKDGEMHAGEVEFYVGSRDFKLEFIEDGDTYAVVVINTGDCETEYTIRVYPLDSETGERAPSSFGFKNIGDAWLAWDIQNKAPFLSSSKSIKSLGLVTFAIVSFEVELPPGTGLENYNLYIEIYPSSMEYYKKDLLVGL